MTTPSGNGAVFAVQCLLLERDAARAAAQTAISGAWIWEAEGNDLASMSDALPVTLTAGTLRGMLAKLRDDLENANGVIEGFGNAEANATIEALREDVRKQGSAAVDLFDECQRMKATIAGLRDDLENANGVIEGYRNDEPPIVRGALDAQETAERALFEARDELGRFQLAIEESARGAADAQVLVYAEPGSEPHAVAPHAVRGILDHIRCEVRNLSGWSLYNKWVAVSDRVTQLEAKIRSLRGRALELDEGDRQMALLAFAKLAVERPGWDDTLNRLSLQIDNADENGRARMYDQFKDLQSP